MVMHSHYSTHKKDKLHMKEQCMAIYEFKVSPLNLNIVTTLPITQKFVKYMLSLSLASGRCGCYH